MTAVRRWLRVEDEAEDARTAPYLPFFVYGTLRHGEGNYARLLAGRTVREAHGARLPAHALFSAGYGFVADSDDPERTVLGDLVWVEPAAYSAVLATVDRLEGYDPQAPEAGAYRRVVRVAEYHDGDTTPTTEAWVYHGSARLLARLPADAVVPSGDWLAHRQAGGR